MSTTLLIVILTAVSTLLVIAILLLYRSFKENQIMTIERECLLEGAMDHKDVGYIGDLTLPGFSGYGEPVITPRLKELLHQRDRLRTDAYEATIIREIETREQQKFNRALGITVAQ